MAASSCAHRMAPAVLCPAVHSTIAASAQHSVVSAVEGCLSSNKGIIVRQKMVHEPGMIMPDRQQFGLVHQVVLL